MYRSGAGGLDTCFYLLKALILRVLDHDNPRASLLCMVGLVHKVTTCRWQSRPSEVIVQKGLLWWWLSTSLTLSTLQLVALTDPLLLL